MIPLRDPGGNPKDKSPERSPVGRDIVLTGRGLLQAQTEWERIPHVVLDQEWSDSYGEEILVERESGEEMVMPGDQPQTFDPETGRCCQMLGSHLVYQVSDKLDELGIEHQLE